MFLDHVAPFALAPEAKQEYLARQLQELLAHHAAGCAEYARLVDDWRRGRNGHPITPADYPYVPVSAFKDYELVSTTGEVMRVQSSATTTGEASKIFVDRATRKRQALSAHRILSDFIGTEQRPCLVFDVEAPVRGTQSLGARAAAILSLAHHATKFYFVMREEGGRLTVDDDALGRALADIGEGPCIAYGFTYILYQAHSELASRGGGPTRLNPDSVFLHSGGWKKLVDLAVDKPTFNRTVAGPWGLDPGRVVDFYGAVEQVGMLYPDCPQGFKHVPYWAELVIRRSDSFEPAGAGETGLIQLINTLPLSAPNHSVLTEDLGEIVVHDGCACGRRGTTFVFRGRAPRAQVRGCSDVSRR
jgi:hypothetical protein